ncbi:Uncharacterized protein OBRU01_04853 [Operophtera brumata]|uniref:Uncharacterized protein n=1 Tax=Operophtera brumata TaxID=104452 RepID=A0A0L7LJQ8_OPEBR|nr:Uncharacterized protein OBRU01_04853 [Operophtera brumata]
MAKWRYCLVLAALLLLPLRTSTEEEEDEDLEEENDENEGDEGEEEEPADKADQNEHEGARLPSGLLRLTAPQTAVTRTILRRPLECYVCAYKVEMQLRSCLDPTKHRATAAHGAADSSHQDHPQAPAGVLRLHLQGGDAAKVMLGSYKAQMNRCNSQAFAIPVLVPRALTAVADVAQPLDSAFSTAAKPIPQTVLFFVTVLLALQTVVKVTVV